MGVVLYGDIDIFWRLRRRFKMGRVSFTGACKLFLWHLSTWDPRRASCVAADTNRLLGRLRAVWAWLEEIQFCLLCYSSRSSCLTIRRHSASVAIFFHLSILFSFWTGFQDRVPFNSSWLKGILRCFMTISFSSLLVLNIQMSASRSVLVSS